ncbi:MAG: hypothetical protein KGQ46_08925 [Hyphomicrobiales bacterium]|nr:hypothetical protein [Hyphomicrobiales bacterium]MDE2113400.1 hypothetical protein [Hyphomicrobiales bacterium]
MALGLSAPALASDARIEQSGPLNIFLGVQNDLSNTAHVTQRGGRNMDGLQQYGYSNNAAGDQHGRGNSNSTIQVGPQNYSDINQGGLVHVPVQQNTAAVIQYNNGPAAQVIGANPVNGPSIQITQSRNDPATMTRQQFTSNGIVNFATIYHTGGVNIITLTPSQLSYGVMGRGH